MVDSLNAIVSFVFDTLTDVFDLYIKGTILTGVLALWLLRKIGHLFDKIR